MIRRRTSPRRSTTTCIPSRLAIPAATDAKATATYPTTREPVIAIPTPTPAISTDATASSEARNSSSAATSARAQADVQAAGQHRRRPEPVGDVTAPDDSAAATPRAPCRRGDDRPDTRPAASTSSAPATSPRATDRTHAAQRPRDDLGPHLAHSRATASVATTTPGPVGTAAHTPSAASASAVKRHPPRRRASGHPPGTSSSAAAGHDRRRRHAAVIPRHSRARARTAVVVR